jgi:hypothetical protein
MVEGAKQCKAIVKPEDGSKPYRCKLGVWTKHPDEGLCFMHHPKVELRGGAARIAIDKGDMEPKTRKAKRRQLKLGKDKGKRVNRKKKRMGRPRAEDKFGYYVHFTEHKVEVGGVIQAPGKVGFKVKGVATSFAEALADTTPSNPLINNDSVYFYTNVGIEDKTQ